MDKTKLVILLTLSLVVIAFSGSVAATNNTTPTQKYTLKVPDPWNTRTGISYTTIQAAIDDARPGDTIIAETGTYTENIQINKTITLKANGTATIKAQNPSQATISITANGAIITGFTIINGCNGIQVQANNCKVTNNKIKNNTNDGIYLCWDSSGNTISNNTITNNNGDGIDFYGLNLNNTVSGNNITNNNGAGISLDYSLGNMISGNKITNNNGNGIIFDTSSNNRIFRNNITNNKGSGIDLVYFSNNNTISENNIKNNNWAGIDLSKSSINNILNNNIINNKWAGIYFWHSSGNVLKGNIIRNCTRGLSVEGGGAITYFIQDIDTSNTIDGKPVYYLLGRANRVYNGVAMGFLALVNCKNITVINVALSGNGQGILIVNTTKSKIQNCNIKNNDEGIQLLLSFNNTISHNKITNNNWAGISLQTSNKTTISWNNITNNKHGIYLGGSDNNKVYRNNFIGNGVQAKVESGSGNLFNLAKPTGGNFWSDYTGKDSNWDGFGDTPYTFTGGQDNLPLIQPLKILSIDPGNGARSIPLNKTIIVTFNWNIFKGPDYNKITVKLPNGIPKTITKTISKNKLYIKATYGWNPGVKFTITIPKNALKNSLGSMLATDFKSSFTAAIKVNSIDPVNGAVNVPKTKTIIVTFSNNILAGPDYNKITVKMPDGTAKTITKWISGNKLYIKAKYGWNPGVKFTVTIPRNAIKNSLGSMLASDFRSSFTVAK